ncbi:SMI1/KNR4 family protein [uncultured Williamsia sp.]|uniref:SMI1/KNR4 family protein n=1 Tax=uncultured Williamsia sp. TaxID=259311 RepID=UPI002618DD83|nr:SMI1/KNR4 family protein [uncultured Williamsia sp.]
MSVSDAWADLMSTLREKAPRTAESFLPPPSAEQVRSVEASTGLDWPGELREFFALHGGQPENNLGGDIFPRQELFGVERAHSERELMIEVWRDLADGDTEYYVGGYDALPVEHPNAGDVAVAFLPQYIPISGLDGWLYFCDVRPGPRRGCVRNYYKDGADEGEPTWESITAMLVGLRSSIESGTVVDGWEPRIVDGCVDWQPRGSDDEAPQPAPIESVVIHTGYESPQVSLSDRDPDDPGADTRAIARAVMAAAAEKYGSDRVGGAQTLIPWIPNTPGFVAGCMAIVDGAQVFHAAVVTETPGLFQVHEIPPGGTRFER